MKNLQKSQITFVLVILFSLEIASLGFMYANPLVTNLSDPETSVVQLKQEVQKLEREELSLTFQIQYLEARNSFLSSFSYTSSKIEISQNLKMLRHNQLLLGRIEVKKSKNIVLINSLANQD